MQVALAYHHAFVRTMRREWVGIDHLRLDKFLLLIRKFVAQALALMGTQGWCVRHCHSCRRRRVMRLRSLCSPSASKSNVHIASTAYSPAYLVTHTARCREERRVRAVADIWRSEVLLPGDTLVAAGISYHLSDLLLPELARCCGELGGGGSAPDNAALRLLLEPFCQALAGTTDAALIFRLRYVCVGWVGGGGGRCQEPLQPYAVSISHPCLAPPPRSLCLLRLTAPADAATAPLPPPPARTAAAAAAAGKACLSRWWRRWCRQRLGGRGSSPRPPLRQQRRCCGPWMCPPWPRTYLT